MLRHVPHFAWGFVLLIVTPALAQNNALEELYGHGVHSYNSADYVAAYDLLTRAIDSGIDDPRCYYFRGLSYIKLGRDPEAKQDFAKAAELEMADTDRFYNVSKSLERIQGRARAMLEKHRADARLTAFQSREQKRNERYRKIRKNEPNVTLPKPADLPPEEAAPMPADETPPDEGVPEETPPEMPADDMPAGTDEDPFSEPGKTAPAEAIDEPAESDDPFADKAKPDEGAEPKETSDDPFGDDDAKSGDEMPDDDDPFGDSAESDGAESDGAKPDDAPADEEMPADDAEPAGDDDDPFGEK
jgi:hypothetical protein